MTTLNITSTEVNEDTASYRVFSSRDEIRLNLINMIKSYLELEDVDLTKTSFVSYIIEILSTLTTNQLFYATSIFREFFLTKAQDPESIYNLASFLGYSPSDAQYASTKLIVSVPLEFQSSSAEFTIPVGHKFYSDEVVFTTDSKYDLTVTNNSSVLITATEDNSIYDVPVSIDTTSDESFWFLLPVYQYEEVIEEAQIDGNLKVYQFPVIEFTISGTITDISVQVLPPNSSTWQTYTEFNSLYLMDEEDFGYIIRKTNSTRKIYFGNGIIGVQPDPGSTVRITYKETLGAAGNVIAGSITSFDRIYTDVNGIPQIVEMSTSNPYAVVDGEDEESTEEIRQNAISNITTLQRFVTEDDYTHTEVVIPNSPLKKSFPVLKRSDLKRNEICLFHQLEFGGDTVPMRNMSLTNPSSNYIPRNTQYTIGTRDYYTIFDMTIDATTTLTAYYDYSLESLTQQPSLVSGYSVDYDIPVTSLEITKDGDDMDFILYYNSTESDYSLCTCVMTIQETGQPYTFTNDYTNKKFTGTVTDYVNVQEGNLHFNFNIYYSGTLVSTYQGSGYLRQSLNSYMLSNVLVDSTTNDVYVYDIPVIEKTYYDSVDQDLFELSIMQELLTYSTYEDYRMLTDFTNIKFTNTIGPLTNMQFNKVTRSSVVSRSLSAVPGSPSLGDRWIVNGIEGGAWEGYEGYIAQCTSASPVTWNLIQPNLNDIIYVTDEDEKYIYSTSGWRLPVYECPLTVQLEIKQTEESTLSASTLISNIKDDLLDIYASHFASNANIYRADIGRIVQRIEDVEYCRVVQPKTDILFNFELTDLTSQELLEYSPQFVYFDEDSISVYIIK